jgi:hypothetical protein
MMGSALKEWENIVHVYALQFQATLSALLPDTRL